MTGPATSTACAAASAASAATALARHGRDEPGVRVALRASAYATFLPFAAAISAEPLRERHDVPATRRLEEQARWLGLGAAASHLVVHAQLIGALGTGLRLESIPGMPGYAALGVLAHRCATDAPRGRVRDAAERVALDVFTAAIAHGYATKARNARVYAPLAALAAGCWAVRA